MVAGAGLLEGDDLEEMLEILIGIAQFEGREFLAYLLRMALMEARNHNAPTTIFHISASGNEARPAWPPRPPG